VAILSATISNVAGVSINTQSCIMRWWWRPDHSNTAKATGASLAKKASRTAGANSAVANPFRCKASSSASTELDTSNANTSAKRQACALCPHTAKPASKIAHLTKILCCPCSPKVLLFREHHLLEEAQSKRCLGCEQTPYARREEGGLWSLRCP
jgi:hypothetical protein